MDVSTRKYFQIWGQVSIFTSTVHYVKFQLFLFLGKSGVVSLKRDCVNSNAAFNFTSKDKSSQLQHIMTGKCIAISEKDNSLELVECNKRSLMFYSLENKDKGM